MRVPQLRRVRRLFVVATAMLASLSLSEHVALSLFIDARSGTTSLISDAGRQRGQIHEIALLSGAIAYDHEPQAIAELAAVIADYRATQNRLIADAAGGTNGGAPSRLLRAYTAPNGIAAQSEVFLSAAERVSARILTDPNASQHNDRQLHADLNSVRSMAHGELARSLDEAATMRLNASAHNIDALRWLHWLTLGAVFAILFGLSRLVFLPMLRQIEQSVGRLTQLAERDHLTQLHNRYAFQALATRETSRARRHDRPVSLCVIDIDHFKQVNDHHGHAMGDIVLKAMAALLENVVRTDDLLARIGGEEFVVLMPDTAMADALLAAERIRDQVEATAQQVVPMALTVSIGVAPVDVDSERALERAMHDADAMLYRAKNAGRNRVWPPAPPRAAAA